LKRPVLLFLVLPLAAYAAVCVLVFLTQSRLVYFPGPPPDVTPAARGLDHRDVAITTADGVRLHGWYLAAPGSRGAVLMSHGNAGNVAGRIPHAEAFLDQGLSILLYDYRGYGRSEGSPSEAGTYRDAEAAYDWLVREAGAERVALYGESLGAGVALELAHRRPAACVVIENAFTSVPALGRRLYPWLPVGLLATIRYDNLAKVGELGAPLLVIHGPGDEIVPFEMGRELFARAAEPKAFLETDGGHNGGGFLRRPGWRAAVGEFVRAALGG
jgi:hypothetical protein